MFRLKVQFAHTWGSRCVSEGIRSTRPLNELTFTVIREKYLSKRSQQTHWTEASYPSCREKLFFLTSWFLLWQTLQRFSLKVPFPSEIVWVLYALWLRKTNAKRIMRMDSILRVQYPPVTNSLIFESCISELINVIFTTI